jgi:hypothetical protein
MHLKPASPASDAAKDSPQEPPKTKAAPKPKPKNGGGGGGGGVAQAVIAMMVVAMPPGSTSTKIDFPGHQMLEETPAVIKYNRTIAGYIYGVLEAGGDLRDSRPENYSFPCLHNCLASVHFPKEVVRIAEQQEELPSLLKYACKSFDPLKMTKNKSRKDWLRVRSEQVKLLPEKKRYRPQRIAADEQDSREEAYFQHLELYPNASEETFFTKPMLKET